MERKGITQVSLSIRTHVARSNISRLLKGEPAYESTLETVCREILDISWREFSDSEISTSGSPHNIPEGGVREGGFFGRDMTSLHQKLTKPGRVRVALSGMGGVGKTELAIQYARQNLQAYPGGICWLVARAEDSNEVGMSTQIISFAQSKLKLKIPFDAPNSLQRCIDNWDAGDVLFIFDDVEKFDSKIKEILNLLSDSRFKVLVTTRLKLRDPFTLFDIDVLDRPESIKLLQWLSERQGVLHEYEDSQKLCNFLGDLPLGIELAGRFLAIETSISTAIFLDLLEKYAERSKALSHESFQGDSQQDPTWSLTARRGLEATFNLTWLILDKETQKIAKLVGRFPPNSLIIWEIVHRMRGYNLWAKEVNIYSTEDVDKSKKILINFNLLKPDGTLTYRLHSLVREFFRSKASIESISFDFGYKTVTITGTNEDLCFTEAVAEKLELLNIKTRHHLTASQIHSISSYIEYLVYITSILKDFLITGERVQSVFCLLGLYYSGIGEDELSKSTLRSLESIFEQERKPFGVELNSKIVWRSDYRKQTILAETHLKKKQFDDAIRLYRKTLNFIKKTLLKVAFNKGGLRLSKLALEISLLKVGDEDCDSETDLVSKSKLQRVEATITALAYERCDLEEFRFSVLSKLGEIHAELENDEIAERIFLKVINLRLRNSQVFNLIYNESVFACLAKLYKKQGKDLLLEESLKKQLEISLEAAGEDSPKSIRCFANLFYFYFDKNELNNAIEYAYKASTLSIKSFVESNPERLMNLGWFLECFRYVDSSIDQNRKYEDFYPIACKDIVNILRSNPELESFANRLEWIDFQIGSAFFHVGEYQNSVKFFKLALQYRINQFGEGDLRIVLICWKISEALFHLHRYEEVIEYCIKVVELNKKHKIAPDYPLLSSLLNLASLHMYLSGDALREVRRDIVEVMKLAPDLESNLSGTQFYLVGCAFHYMDDYINSLEAYKKALPLTINEFGEENSQTFSIYDGIAFSLLRLERHEESVEYYNKVLELSDKYKLKNYPIQLRVLQALFHLFNALEKDDIILKSKLVELLKLAPELEETLKTRSQLNLLQNAFFSVGDDINSLRVLTNLLSLTIDELGEMSSEVVIIYFNLGENLFFVHRFEESRTFLKKAITLALEVLGVENESTKVLQNQYQSLLSQMSSNEAKTV